MNNDIYNIDLTRNLPPVLRKDANIRALAEIITSELQETARLIKNNIIYSRLDELPEKLLDILAYDLHIDWYDYDYPIDVKRDLIKTSVLIHKKLGTKYAVETALGVLFPQSQINEWFEYDSSPFFFRVVLEIGEVRIKEIDFEKIIKIVCIYKRLTAHLENVTYKYQTKNSVKLINVSKIFMKYKIKAKIENEVEVKSRLNVGMGCNYAIKTYPSTVIKEYE